MEKVKVRDWLGELEAAGRAEDIGKFQGIVAEMAGVESGLKAQACEIAGIFFDKGEVWAAELCSKAKAKEAAQKAEAAPPFCDPIQPTVEVKKEVKVEAAKAKPVEVEVVEAVKRPVEFARREDRRENHPSLAAKPELAKPEAAGLAAIVEEIAKKAGAGKAEAKPEMAESEGEEEEPEAVRPVGPLWLPGVCGEIQDYYLATSMTPSPIMSLAPAVMIPAVLISGKIIGPSGPKGCSPHLYTVLIAPTTSGKQHVIDVSKECLKACGAEKLIGTSRFKSGPGVIHHITDQPISLCVMDEYGPFLAKLGDPKSLGCERDIADRIKELWSLNPGSIYNTPVGAAGASSEALEGVLLSILGLGVRDEFYAACQDIQIANGLLNRKLIIEEPNDPPDNFNPSTKKLPWSLMDNLVKLQNLRPKRLEWDAGAREIFEEAKRELRREDEQQRRLWARGPEMMVRLATGIASARFSRSGIERSDMEIADVLVKRSAKFFEKGIEDAQSRKEMRHAELVREIERRVRNKFGGQASRAEIGRTFKNNKTHKDAVTNALADMVDSGTFEEVKIQTGGREKVVLRLWRR
jgi:hypothetical protein